MTITPFTGTITLAQLRANFDDTTATLTANAALGEKNWDVPLAITGITSTTDLSLRSQPFTPEDDAQIDGIFVAGTVAAGSATLTATLIVDNGDTTWLLDSTAVTATTSGAGAISARTDLSGSGTALRVLSGVRYRLVVTVSGGTINSISAALRLRSKRRRA